MQELYLRLPGLRIMFDTSEPPQLTTDSLTLMAYAIIADTTQNTVIEDQGQE